ncbi:MAG: glycosyltransferase family 39 protein [Candidatus Sungiibacteriota bacterium]
MHKPVTFWLWFIVPIAISVILYGAFLSRLPFEDADEATYAMVTREMIESGDFMTLTLFGEPWVDKPPLLFWLMAGSAKIFGLNEFALRLPSAIFGILAVVFTMGIIWELTKNKEATALGGLILVLFPLFLAAARNVRMDVPVTAAILGSLYFFIRGRTVSLYLIGFGVALGVGVLLKSVVALLAVPSIFIYSILYRDWGWFKNRYFWMGNGLGLLTSLPWHFYEAWVWGPAFFIKYFGFQLGRVTRNVIQSGITNGYVLWVFWKYGQPWSSLFVISSTIFAIFLRRKKEIVFAFAAFVLTFGIFMLPTTKLVTYFIPSYPFLAIFLAVVYGGIFSTMRPVSQNILRAAVGLALIVAMVFSIREAFFESRLYVTKQAVDSKEIGTLLSRKSSDTPIYLYENPSDQAIQYYSRRKATHLTEEKGVALSPPFFLVIPTSLVKENEWLGEFPKLYSGIYLTLVSVERDE